MFELQSICVQYGSRRVLQDVSLRVEPGKVTVLIGPNGAGKSTLIRAASGVLPLQSGRVCIAGQNLASMSSLQRARKIGVVPQARNLPAAFSVFEAVLLGRTPYLGWGGQACADDHARVTQALERTQLLALANRPVGELSGGEQQRVLLARALAQDTPILLLDEPTTHLDLQHQSSLLNLVRSLADEAGKTILMALHDLNLAGMYADRVVILVEGRIRHAGTPQEVLTERNLAAVYRVPVHVMRHPQYGSPLVLPAGQGVSARPDGRESGVQLRPGGLD